LDTWAWAFVEFKIATIVGDVEAQPDKAAQTLFVTRSIDRGLAALRLPALHE
jgi:hypothetical protein